MKATNKAIPPLVADSSVGMTDRTMASKTRYRAKLKPWGGGWGAVDNKGAKKNARGIIMRIYSFTIL